jgi:hypothetical protein
MYAYVKNRPDGVIGFHFGILDHVTQGESVTQDLNQAVCSEIQKD